MSCCWTAMIVQWTFIISQGNIKTINWTQNFRIIQCSVFQGKTSFQIRMMRGLIIPLLLLSHNSHTKCRSHWELFVPTAHSLNARCTFLCPVYNADCKKTPDCFFSFQIQPFLYSENKTDSSFSVPGRTALRLTREVVYLQWVSCTSVFGIGPLYLAGSNKTSNWGKVEVNR